jgi:hypothetical protein
MSNPSRQSRSRRLSQHSRAKRPGGSAGPARGVGTEATLPQLKEHVALNRLMPAACFIHRARGVLRARDTIPWHKPIELDFPKVVRSIADPVGASS